MALLVWEVYPQISSGLWTQQKRDGIQVQLWTFTPMFGRSTQTCDPEKGRAEVEAWLRGRYQSPFPTLHRLHG